MTDEIAQLKARIAQLEDENKELKQALNRSQAEQKETRAKQLTTKNSQLSYKNAQLERLNNQIKERNRKIANINHELRQSEILSQAISDNVPLGIFVSDLDGKAIYTNPRYQQITGLSLEKASGYRWSNQIHPDDKVQFLEQWKQATTQEKTDFKASYRFFKNDKLIWLYARVSAILDQGKKVGYIGIIEDITERKQTEENLRKSEEKYRLIFQKSPIGILHYDKNGVATDCNRAHLKILGSTHDKVIGLNMLKSLEDDNMKNYIVRSLQGESCHYEGYYTSTTGKKRSFLKINFVPLGKQGQVEGAMAIVDDRSAEALASEQEQKNKYYRKLQAAMWQLAASETNSSETELIKNLFRLVGHGIRPSRITLNRVNEQNELQYAFGWIQKDMLPPPKNIKIPQVVWKEYSKKRYYTCSREEILRACRENPRFRPHSALIHYYIEKSALQSLLFFPFELNKKIEGFICFEWCQKQEKQWQLAEIFTGQDMSKILSTSISKLRAEKTLSTSEEKYRTLVNMLHDGIVISDPQGKIIFANHQIQDITGFRPDELIGENLQKIISPRQTEKIGDYLEGKHARKLYETVLNSKKQKQVVAELNTKAIEYQHQSAFITLIRDLSQRKQQEEEKARLGVVIEQITEAVIIVNTQGKIEYLNRAFEKMTGYSLNELKGKNIEALRSHEHEDNFLKALNYIKKHHKTWTGTSMNCRKNGTLYEEQMVLSPVKNSFGETTHYVAVKRDVTEKNKMQRHLQQIQKLQAVGTLASGIAHDFNNILMAMQVHTELIKASLPAPSPDVLSYITNIETTQERGQKLIQQILSFSRQNDSHEEPVLLHLVVKETINMLRASLPTTLQIKQRIEDCGYVLGAPTHIQQIVMNLFTNASHAMKGQGTLYVALEKVSASEPAINLALPSEQKHWIRLQVSDTGKGMSKTIQERIFEPFFTTKKVGDGTGLGLAIVHGIVKRYGGQIFVESQIGKGTSFYVYLPPDKKIKAQ